jgi:hypothetical protein
MHEEAAREIVTVPAWLSPLRRRRAPPVLRPQAQPLVLVAEDAPVLTPLVADLCSFLRVRVEHVPPAGLEAALERHPVGVLCHAPVTGASVAQVLRAVVANDPGLPVLVVTERDASREARLAVAAEIIRLDHLVWLDRLPDLRRMVEFLFLAERRTGKAALMADSAT